MLVLMRRLGHSVLTGYRGIAPDEDSHHYPYGGQNLAGSAQLSAS